MIDEAAIWGELAAACADRQHGWRTAVLATVAEDGTADARCLVLREADRSARKLSFFTDPRSAKVAQLIHEPRASVVLWSSTLRWQLRLAVTVGVQTEGPEVAARWRRIAGTSAARDYMQAAGGEPAFAVLTARIRRIEWLELHRDGQHRAVFDQL